MAKAKKVILHSRNGQTVVRAKTAGKVAAEINRRLAAARRKSGANG